MTSCIGDDAQPVRYRTGAPRPYPSIVFLNVTNAASRGFFQTYPISAVDPERKSSWNRPRLWVRFCARSGRQVPAQNPKCVK